MGGLLICISVVISTFLCRPNVYVVCAMVVFLLLTAVGFADDFLKISKNSKGLKGK